jgi:hypothetical protein
MMQIDFLSVSQIFLSLILMYTGYYFHVRLCEWMLYIYGGLINIPLPEGWRS